MSHQNIIIHGANYSADGTPPPEGQAAVEISYTPSDSLTPAQKAQKIKRLLELADKIYAIESAPEE